MRRVAIAAALALILAAGMAPEVRAENTKGRWQLGGGFSFVSTVDDIRNNSAFIVFEQPGPDGVPNTGDETITGYDIRNDDLVARESTLQEGLRFDLNFSYGVTDWFSLQVDSGYYEANLVQLDTFTQEVSLADFNGDGILGANETDVFQQSQPIVAGSVTQIPLTLSGIFRFLRDSPVNPYFGIGGGMVFVDATPSSDLQALDNKLQGVSDSISIKQVFPNQAFIICQGEDCGPYQGIQLQADNTTQWHLMAGLEYFVNSNLSIYFDARYNFISQDVRVDVDGDDQVLFTFTSPSDTLTFCDDPSLDVFFQNPAFSGFDRTSNGVPDVCRPGNGTRFSDQLLVQGGSIDISAFNIGVGVRWAF